MISPVRTFRYARLARVSTRILAGMLTRVLAGVLTSVPAFSVFAAAPAVAATDEHPVRICLAPPSAQMPGVHAEQAMTAVRESFVGFLTGPTLSAEPLTARLASQARVEAKQKNCTHVLFTTVTQERKTKSDGLLGRIAAGAVQSGASQVAMNTGSAGTRVLASATAGGAANTYIASTVRTSDKLTLTSRLEGADGNVLMQKKEARKATSDGEDMLTPLVERAAESIVGAMSSLKR
jgi:hypothetical protein